MTRRRFDGFWIGGRGPNVILDIAVPTDFDPRIHDGDGHCYSTSTIARIGRKRCR